MKNGALPANYVKLPVPLSQSSLSLNQGLMAQEEPQNMGAWNTVRNYINRVLKIINSKSMNIGYIGRNASSSTATGNLNKHLAQQKEILEKVIS